MGVQVTGDVGDAGHHGRPGEGEQVGLLRRLNTCWHRPALWVLFFITIAHWVEHLVQAGQIWLMGWDRPDSRGVLGQWIPFLAEEEWLHFGYAVVMLAGIALLWPGMTGRARVFWTIALVIQTWHFVEHGLLFVQSLTAAPLFGQATQTSVIQLIVPRVELHLFYNLVVFVPMLIGMYFHKVPPAKELSTPAACSCRLAALQPRKPSAAAA